MAVGARDIQANEYFINWLTEAVSPSSFLEF